MSNIYRIKEFAKRVGRAPSSIRRWEQEGKLIAKRMPSGHRYFDETDVRIVLGGMPDKRLTVVYCRVSSAGQKDDLASQIAAMEQYCQAGAIAVDDWITEVSGGMNFKRKQFLALIDRVQRGEIARVLIAHKDRLVRFGFDLLQHLFTTHGCEIIVVNQASLSPEQEMVEDLLAIVHTFSCRLYGMRKYKKTLQQDYAALKLKEPKSILS